ncbi:MAG: hypothetical protein RMM53_00590 [Bacteroidia bacterium]|nr:hypothetical protein [Bacteroidia bacterium]MDW8332692.1 hypothetical protein [Bacteroidia bacterium]
MRISAALCACLSLLSCRKAPLREGIPLYFGIRVEAQFDSLRFVRDLDAVKAYGAAGLVVEVAPEREPATLFPVLPDRVRRNAVAVGRAAAAAGLPVTWVWTRNENPPLFVEPWPDSAALFKTLLWEYFSILDSVPRPERVIIGWDYAPVERFGWECALCDTVRRRYGCKTSYIYAAPNEKTFDDCFDEGAVAFPPLAVEETRKSARIQHSALPASSRRPLFAAAVNVLGPDKAKALENRRRFLPKDLPISGMTLNSIYSRPVVCDSFSPFGMARDSAALAAVKRWTGVK